MLLSRPDSELELLARCKAIEGFSFAQLASALQLIIPENPVQRKGWTGQAVEQMLGANSGNLAQPDFHHLGIELKTIPLNHLGNPKESTFITSIPLLTLHKQTWKTSQCFSKLKKILWLPVEGDTAIAFPHRRIGRAILWTPSVEEEAILACDWNELTLMIGTGKLAEIDATFGQYLQVRPKAAHAKSLCYGLDEEGNKILTLPRGFYLRTCFTGSIVC